METKAGTIVVGVDGSQSSTRALAWAVEQAVAEHRALTLVHTVLSVTPAYLDAAIVSPHEAMATLRAEGQKVLDDAHSKVRATAPNLEVHEVFDYADPREVLLQLSMNATMLVLGSRGRGQLRSLLLGSVGVALIRHAQCPVVVHRPGNPGTVRNGIVVGADASEDSLPVLEFAYRVASLRKLPLSVLYSHWDIQAGTIGAYPDSNSAAQEEAERVAVAESVAGLAEKYPDLNVSIQMAHGRPQEVLLRSGERMNLIVVGAHQANRAAQMVFGSVSVAVVEHANCPVAVVPVSTPR